MILESIRAGLFDRFCLTLVLACLSFLEVVGGTFVEANSQVDLWRTSERCGVNSAYAFLKMQNKDVAYGTLVSKIPIGPKGSTIGDVASCINDYGVLVDVVKCTPSALNAIHMPVIAHTFPEYASEYSLSQRGHFIVLLKVDEQFVVFLDGTTAVIREVSYDRFISEWSGHLIIRKQRDLLSPILFLILGLLVFVFLILKFHKRIKPLLKNFGDQVKIEPPLGGVDGR